MLGCRVGIFSSKKTAPSFTTGQVASLVIGQPDFTTATFGCTSSRCSTTWLGALINGTYLYIGDNLNNHRFLIFNTLPTSNGPVATGVLGQPDFTTTTSGCTQNKFNSPNSIRICSANNKLYVVDCYNQRIMVYNSPPTGQVNADSVMGQPDFTSNGGGCGPRSFFYPRDIFFVGSKCLLTDYNHRVLIWNDITTYNQSSTVPDIILGQPDATTNTIRSVSANSFQNPEGVWSDGTKVIVGDSVRNRVLIWNTFPTINNQNADIVIGQPDFITSTSGLSNIKFNNCQYVGSNGIFLAISDRGNTRILVWYSIPTATNTPADAVLGQTNFTSNSGGTSSTKFNNGVGVGVAGNDIYAFDSNNYRVLKFTNGS